MYPVLSKVTGAGIGGMSSLGFKGQYNSNRSPVLLTVNALSPTRPRTHFAHPRFTLLRSDCVIRWLTLLATPNINT